MAKLWNFWKGVLIGAGGLLLLCFLVIVYKGDKKAYNRWLDSASKK